MHEYRYRQFGYAGKGKRLTVDLDQPESDIRKSLDTAAEHFGFHGQMGRCWTVMSFASMHGIDSKTTAPPSICDLVFEIDGGVPLEVIEAARKIVRGMIEDFDVPAEAIDVYFSGGKSIHVVVLAPYFFDDGVPPIIDSHAVVRLVCLRICEAAGVRFCRPGKAGPGETHVDASNYDYRHLLRLPGAIHHETGLHKVRISETDLLDPALDMDDLRQRAKIPRTLQVVPLPRHDNFVEPLNRLLHEELVARRASLASAKQAKPHRQATNGQSVVYPTAAAVAGQVHLGSLPPCIESLTQGALKGRSGVRNAVTVPLAVWLQHSGLSQQDAAAVLGDWAVNHIPSGLGPEGRRGAAASTIASVYRSGPNYHFTARTCRSLDHQIGLACKDTCPHYKDYRAAFDGSKKSIEFDPAFNPAPDPKQGSLFDAESGIVTTVSRCLRSGQLGIRVIHADPGTKKTFSTLPLAARWAEEDPDKPKYILYVAPTYDLLEQAVMYASGHEVRIFHPRNADNCVRPGQCNRAVMRGRSAVELVCKRCPEFLKKEKCDFLRQYWEIKSPTCHWAITTARLVHHPDLVEKFHAVILDEWVGSAVFGEWVVDSEAVEQASKFEFTALPPMRADYDYTGQASFSLEELGSPEGDAHLTALAIVRETVKTTKTEPHEPVLGVAALRALEAHTPSGTTLREAIDTIDPELFCLAEESIESDLSDAPRPWLSTMVACLREFYAGPDTDDPQCALPLALAADVDDSSTTILKVKMGRRLSEWLAARMTFVLDATYEEEAWEAVLPKPPVEVHSFHVPYKAPVLQVVDGEYPMATLVNRDGKLRLHILDRIRDRILPFVRQWGPTLIVSYKRVISDYFQRKDIAEMFPADTATGWFGGIRGVDFTHVQGLVVIGAPYPNEDDIILQAMALKNGHAMDTTVSGTAVHYRTPAVAGRGQPCRTVRTFEDPLLRSLMFMAREAEDYQVMHRPRQVRDPSKPTLRFTARPLPWTARVPVQLVRAKDLDVDAFQSGTMRSTVLGDTSGGDVGGLADRMLKAYGFTSSVLIRPLIIGGSSVVKYLTQGSINKPLPPNQPPLSDLLVFATLGPAIDKRLLPLPVKSASTVKKSFKAWATGFTGGTFQVAAHVPGSKGRLQPTTFYGDRAAFVLAISAADVVKNGTLVVEVDGSPVQP